MNLSDPDCGSRTAEELGMIGFNAQFVGDVQEAGLIISNTVTSQGCDAEL
jgi:hypothetical protein